MGARLIIKPEGDAIASWGYDDDWSEVFVLVLPDRRIESHSKVLRIARRFVNFIHRPGERLDDIINEDDDAAMARVDAFIESQGGIVKPTAKKGRRKEERDVTVRKGMSTGTIELVIAIVRRIYNKLRSLGLRTGGNPCNLLGWHLWEFGEQFAFWRTRNPHATHGFEHAGLRLSVGQRTRYPPLLHDAIRVGWQMVDALVQSQQPATVIEISQVQNHNGCRWREAAFGNALGWALEQFGPSFRTSNKHEASRFAKTLDIPPEALSGLVDRMTGQSHPDDDKRTRMDWLRELFEAGDFHELAKVALFPGPRGGVWSSSGFNWRFRKAMRSYRNADGSIGLMVHSDIGSRRPSPHWFRHAVISIEVERIYKNYTSKLEIKAAVDDLCEKLGLQSDQSTRYAARIIKRRAEYERQQDAERRRLEGMADRAKVELDPGTLRIASGISEAAKQIRLFPARVAA